MSAANIQRKIAEIRSRCKNENRAAFPNEVVFLNALQKALADKSPESRWEKYKDSTSQSKAPGRVEHAISKRQGIEYR